MLCKPFTKTAVRYFDHADAAEARKWLNEIEEKKANPFLKILSYFCAPIPWMIEAAVILSAVDRHWPDFGIIFTLLLANGVVGFWKEHQAGDPVEVMMGLAVDL